MSETLRRRTGGQILVDQLKIHGVDLAFVGRDLPGMKRIIMMHRLRTPQDFNLFRLVLLMRAVFADDAAKAGPVCVAGHLIDPVSHVQISGVLRRMGLNQIRSHH